MMIDNVEVTPFKRWYIKKIEFSNFLSYGDNQVINFDKCNGITVVESDPPNFGGKTVLTVDLLLFLFFNTTTKTQKAEEIFNRFTDKNVVSVSGDILIDGEEYIIARKIERKKSKSGDWTVKTELDFFKKLSDGQLQNFTGEQRRETENFIKTSIGSMDDFLMTIVTTASNLEDLLEAKPTARGQVLSRFLGLEFLKQKEETGKEIYSEFSKGMLSNVYNTESLKQDNDSSKEEIKRLESEITVSLEKMSDVDLRLQKGQEYKDNLLKSKYADLDKEFTAYSEKIKLTIDDLVLRLADTFKNESALSQRVNQESVQVKDDQKKFFEKEQEKSEKAAEFRRLFRIFYLEANNLKTFSDKNLVSDAGIPDPSNSSSIRILSLAGNSNSLSLNVGGGVDSLNPKKNFLEDGSTFSDFKDEISSLKSLLSSLNKYADGFAGSVSGAA
jgi:DNA repair exonuclease SbcCD ATPase subunit